MPARMSANKTGARLLSMTQNFVSSHFSIAFQAAHEFEVENAHIWHA